jgi:hypothetical protein
MVLFLTKTWDIRAAHKPQSKSLRKKAGSTRSAHLLGFHFACFWPPASHKDIWIDPI